MPECGGGGQDSLAGDRVLAHEGPFLLGQRTGLAQDRLGDRDLADVVQLGAEGDQLDLIAGQPERRAVPIARRSTSATWSVRCGSRWASAESSVRATSCGGPRATRRVLVRVHALVGEPQRLRGVRGLLGQHHAADGRGDLEPVAPLAEHGVGGAEHRLARVTGGEQHAELVAAHPEGRGGRR